MEHLRAGLKLNFRKVLVYDNNGDLIKNDMFNPSDLDPVFATTYSYGDFDPAGNWTKRVATTKLSDIDGVESVEYRVITYYK